ncbi:MAG: biopolymer transporter ExbD [Rikenellaceae bacterium]|nr:biopolymer transporter ExbD [Rikenellaceae bacterium]
MARKTPEINASSMADVAFLLLIFFLVATTMDIDSGLNRVLPPWSEKQTDAPDIKERNLLLVHVNKYDQIAVQGELLTINQLKDRAKEWVLNRADDDNLPEKKVEEIALIGKHPVSQGVISLQNDRATSYEMYIKVQNELTRAFNEIRDELSKAHFGKVFLELEKEQQDAIAKAVPMKISEAEPQNIK